jgi:hypothetical protein
MQFVIVVQILLAVFDATIACVATVPTTIATVTAEKTTTTTPSKIYLIKHRCCPLPTK